MQRKKNKYLLWFIYILLICLAVFLLLWRLGYWDKEEKDEPEVKTEYRRVLSAGI